MTIAKLDLLQSSKCANSELHKIEHLDLWRSSKSENFEQKINEFATKIRSNTLDEIIEHIEKSELERMFPAKRLKAYLRAMK